MKRFEFNFLTCGSKESSVTDLLVLPLLPWYPLGFLVDFSTASSDISMENLIGFSSRSAWISGVKSSHEKGFSNRMSNTLLALVMLTKLDLQI